jgi:hypothetical protein
MERGSSQQRPANWTARILAPVALVVVALVVTLVVSGSLGGDDDGDGKGGKRERVVTTGCEPNDAGRQALSNGYYVLQPGDDFASLAEITCMPVEEIQRLNPDLDPQLLPQGGCVDLRRDGCKVLASP